MSKPTCVKHLVKSAIESGKRDYWQRTDAENMARYLRNLREFTQLVDDAAARIKSRAALKGDV